MLDHDVTMELIRLAQQGDEHAKTKLIEENTPLLKSIIRRYVGKVVEYDDLFQISSVGLLKAINNFSLDYNVKFSTYAVPMVIGEVKRFIRDDGYVKVSRSVKTQANKISQWIEAYRKTHQHEPSVEDIATEFKLEISDVVFIMDSTKSPISLFEKINDSDDKSLCLMDKIPSNTKDEDLIDRVILKAVIKELTQREKKIIIMRYFRDMTQSDIAKQLGVSQVQVSRLENKILEKIKAKFVL